MSAEPNSPLGLLLSDDLIDASRVTGTARPLDLTVKSARSPEALVDLASRERPTCVLLDLNHPNLAVGELLRRLQEACGYAPRVVAFGSHVDAAGLRAAREAGCDVVLPRSKFVEDLPRLLPAWLAPRG
jgi:CheY-like chemotaxis protein